MRPHPKDLTNTVRDAPRQLKVPEALPVHHRIGDVPGSGRYQPPDVPLRGIFANAVTVFLRFLAPYGLSPCYKSRGSNFFQG